MRIPMSTPQFVEKAKLVHNNPLYDYSQVKYLGMLSPVTIICREHGTFSIRPDAILYQNQGCRQCGILRRQHPGKLTTTLFIQFAEVSWGNRYDYSLTQYVNKSTKIQYTCKDHGIVSQIPLLHIKHGCPFCAGRGISKHTVESFIKRAREVHGNLYDYSKVILSSINDKVIIICPHHGEFTQKAANHINLRNHCPQCFGGVGVNTAEFLKRAKIQHGERFDYTEMIYTKAHEKISITCRQHGTFTQLAYMHLQSEHSCPYCVAELTSSAAEKEIVTYLKERYQGKIITNDRTILGFKEIDIYLPDLKVGIEYHGNYFHTEVFVGKQYHKQKADLAELQGIHLIQFFEHEWNTKKAIIQSRLDNVLGINQVIYARQTEIVELSTTDKNLFLDKSHLQGKDKSSFACGLMHRGILVACMTFGLSRYYKQCRFELMRFANLPGIAVIGGASKLFKYFRSQQEGSVISYSDRRWSSGKMYEKIGFKAEGVTEPGYFYYNIKKKTVHSRLSFQKQKLKHMPFYDESLTEYDIMKLNGYERIWDAGHKRWIYA